MMSLKRIEEKRPKFSYRRVIFNETHFGAIVSDTSFLSGLPR